MTPSMRCTYTRWQMSNALDRGQLAARLSRGHAARCTACQAFGQRLDALDTQLALGGAMAPLPARAPRPARRRLLIAAPLALGAAAAVALVVRGPAPVERITSEAPAPRQIVGALAGVRQVADRVTQAFADTPLETELDDLIRDGKRGVHAVLSIGGLR